MRFIAPLLWAALVSTAEADAVLSTPSTRATENGSLTLTLTLLNETGAPQSIHVPNPLLLRAETQSTVAIIEAQPDRTGAIEVPADGFTQVRLTLVLPHGMSGATRLQPAGIAANPLLVQIAAAQASDAPVAAEPAPGFEVIDKPPPLALSPYEPVYVVIGGDGGLNAKFQISLRYRMFDGNGRLASQLPWLDDLYLAYSQTSLWDLGELSKPFRDSSYRPRLFYGAEDLVRLFDGRMRVNLEAGFGHESNGREGDESRSFNMFYARPTFIFGQPDGLRAYISPLVHNYVAANENEDLAHYRGYVDWQLGIGSEGGLDLSTTLRKGTRSDYGSIEVTATYPLSKLSGGDLTGWLMLQYFGGYGESLLDYRRKLDSQFRLGIAVAL
jgi:phospholipase A1